MFEGFKIHWQDLKAGRPGHRFQDHYRKRHGEQSGPWRKVFFLGVGAMVVAAGLFFLPAPGPGFLIIFLGGGMMAQESRHAAKVLDWSEQKVRAVIEWAVATWQRASPAGKGAIVTLVLVLTAGAGYLAYRILFASAER